MDLESEESERFRGLPKTHRDQYGRILHELMMFAQAHTIPLCFSPSTCYGRSSPARGRGASD